mgnify:CR=1 FL=1
MRSDEVVVFIYANPEQNEGGGWANVSDFPYKKKIMYIWYNPLLPYIL